MKLGRLVLSCALFVGVASAQDVMQKSMSIMEQGMTQIQQGFFK